MKTFLIVFVFYQSIGIKQSNSALTVTEIEQPYCEALKKDVVAMIESTSTRIDRIIARCKTVTKK